MAPSKPTPKPLPDPDVDDGIKYWAAQPANYDGVLGMSPARPTCTPPVILICRRLWDRRTSQPRMPLSHRAKDPR